MNVKADLRDKPRISQEEYREKLGLKRLDEFGAELPDPTPIEPPVNMVKHPSVFENMRALVRAELQRTAKDQGFETEDEAENFGVDEDEVPRSRHQYTEMDEEFVTKSVATHNKKIADADKHKAAQAAVVAPKPEPTKEGQGPAEPAREALDAPEGSGKAKK